MLYFPVSKTSVKNKSGSNGSAGNNAELVRKWAVESFYAHIIIMALLGILAYSNTLHAPFQWDESEFIEKNPIVKDLSYFLGPSKAEGLDGYNALKGRYIGYLTFAINYRISGLNVIGFHIVNIAIHIINSLLVYLLVLLTFKTPFLSGSPLSKHSKTMALFSALLFVSHPVQTEAVTYVFQRLASLMTMFYLLSIVAYIKYRSLRVEVRSEKLKVGSEKPKTNNKVSVFWYLLSVACAILAMKTKENAFTLPLMITLYEFLFFKGPILSRLLRLVPLLFTLVVIPLTLVSMDRPVSEVMEQLGAATKGQYISRPDYLLTQFRVIVTYIRLVFFPVGQNVYYDYSISHSIFNTDVLFSLAIICAVIGSGFRLLWLSGKYESGHSPDLRLISFGILWFFIALSVESSIVAIPMVINEYRVYLPSVGAFISMAAGTLLLLQRLDNNKVRTALISSFIVLPILLSCATYSRNNVWATTTGLWEDVVAKSPGKAGGHYNLATAYKTKGLIDKAVEHYLLAIKLKPDYAEAYNSLGVVYEAQGLIEKAIEHYHYALQSNPAFAEAYNNLGLAYRAKGLNDKAIENIRISLKIKPGNAEAYNNLGTIYAASGLIDKAVEHYIAALKLKPDYAEAHYNLAMSYFSKGMVEMARSELESILRLAPENTQARRFLDYVSSQGKTR